MSIEIRNLDVLQRELRVLNQNLTPSNMQTKLNTIGNMLKNNIKYSFERETSPFGKRWKPVSSVTAFIYARGKVYTSNKKRQTKGFLSSYGAGGSKRILRLSGNLADNWSVDATHNEVVVSNNSSFKGFSYGLTHQFGTDNAFGKGIKIPARPFLPIDENNNLENGLKSVLEKYLNRALLE